MQAFVLILQLIVLGLLLTMLYTLTKLKESYHREISGLAEDIGLLDHRVRALERKIRAMEKNKDNDDD